MKVQASKTMTEEEIMEHGFNLDAAGDKLSFDFHIFGLKMESFGKWGGQNVSLQVGIQADQEKQSEVNLSLNTHGENESPSMVSGDM